MERKKQCPNCGTNNSLQSKFCSKCGYDISTTGVISQAHNDHNSTKRNISNVLDFLKAQISRRKKTLTIIAVIIIVVMAVSWITNSKTDLKDIDSTSIDTDIATAFDPEKAEKELSDKVTKDYLPGTYKSSDGEYFAIKITDESIFNIPGWLGVLTQYDHTLESRCKIISSEAGWLQESGEIYIAPDKKIYIDGKTKAYYDFDFKNGKLTLTDYQDNKKTYKKISDEYNAKLFINKNAITPESIEGYYTGKDSIVRIDKSNDNEVNIYSYTKDYVTKEMEIEYIAENIPVIEFSGNNTVCLKGKDNYTLTSLHFISRREIVDEGSYAFYRTYKDENYTHLNGLENNFKSEHNNIDYNYSSFDDDIIIAKGNKYNFAFNYRWYLDYNTFDYYNPKQEQVHTLEIKNPSGEVLDIYIDGIKYDSFNAKELDGTDQRREVLYITDNAKMIIYNPDAVDSQNKNIRPTLVFTSSDNNDLGMPFETDGKVEFSYAPIK